MTTLTAKITERKDTAAAWTAANPVLSIGEIGIESDTNKFKIGTGANWNSITKYFVDLDFIEDLIDTPIRDCGSYNASTNAFPATGGTGVAGAIEKGNLFTISVSGVLGGVAVSSPYDTIRARVDNPGQTLANWAIQSNTTPATIVPIITTITSSATPTIVISSNVNTVDVLEVTALAVNAVFAVSGTPVNGKRILLRWKDNGVSKTTGFPASFRAIGVTLQTSTLISKWQYALGVWNSASSKWDILAVGTEL